MFFDKWFGNKKKKQAGAAKSGTSSVLKELPVKQPTVGLCFNYQRGLAFDSEVLSDEGLNQVMATLKRHDLRATFNVPAKLCDAAPEQIALINNAGHEIAVLGYRDEKIPEMADEVLKQMLLSCKNAFAKRRISPVGFRAPHSHWDERLMQELSHQGYRYSAEHDHAKHPYLINGGPNPLVRLPVCTDDRGLRHKGDKRNEIMSKHIRNLRKAIARNQFVSILFHPWIIYEEKELMEHWESWLESAVQSGAKVMAMEDVLKELEIPDVPG